MSEKSLEQKVQACENAESQTVPFNLVTKFTNKCGSKEVQNALAEKRANKQDLLQTSTRALKGTDERSVRLKEAADNT